MTLYDVLGITPDATATDIKKAYRRLSMMYHPDRNKEEDTTAKFQELSEAYEILSDPIKKKDYDETLDDPLEPEQEQTNTTGGFTQDAIGQLFQHLFNIPFQANLDTFDFSNFGKPTPIVQHISLTMHQLWAGTTIPIEVERWIVRGPTTKAHSCKENERETLYVHIPRGTDEGELIVLTGKGNVWISSSGTYHGDVKLCIKCVSGENETEFRRNGLDLTLVHTITVKEALCGFTFELVHLDGKVYALNNNAGNIMHHGFKKVIPNMGFTREVTVTGQTSVCTGNLIIEFHVKFPVKLSKPVLEALTAIDF